jgi:2-hydroxy-3-oxopropionate reductase
MEAEPVELSKEPRVAMRIAFLGIGLMGRPMAEKLIGKGNEVGVWNRTRSKAEPLAALGAAVFDDPAEATAEADVVCMILENGAAVESVLFDRGAADALRPGALVIDMSSIAPERARDHAARLKRLGVDHLDAPVSGGPYGAEAASLAIMVGGEAAAVERARPILAALGTATHVGPSGCGQIAKLGSQLIVAAAIAAASEALLLAKANGADPERVRQALSGGFADSKILQIHAKRMIGRDFRPGGHIRTHRKDLDAAVGAAREAALDLPMLRFVHDVLGELCDAGLGECDHAALILGLESKNRPLRLSDNKDLIPDQG